MFSLAISVAWSTIYSSLEGANVLPRQLTRKHELALHSPNTNPNIHSQQYIVPFPVVYGHFRSSFGYSGKTT